MGLQSQEKTTIYPRINHGRFESNEEMSMRKPPNALDNDRLSPNFVEYMMGLPEGWVTDLPISRAQQFKMLGNGVVPQQAYYALEKLWHMRHAVWPAVLSINLTSVLCLAASAGGQSPEADTAHSGELYLSAYWPLSCLYRLHHIHLLGRTQRWISSYMHTTKSEIGISSFALLISSKLKVDGITKPRTVHITA